MFIIAIGASAGGLQALKEFFKVRQHTQGESYVVILHSLRNYHSHLDAILSRITAVPCLVIEDGMEIVSDSILIHPPSHRVSIIEGRFSLEERPEDEKVNFTVNHFFESLANNSREKAVGVIMSGTGTDGTVGSRAIEDNGGVVIVQDPATAQFDGMPLTSIRYDHPDYIASPADMPALIDSIITGKENPNARKQRALIY